MGEGSVILFHFVGVCVVGGSYHGVKVEVTFRQKTQDLGLGSNTLTGRAISPDLPQVLMHRRDIEDFTLPLYRGGLRHRSQKGRMGTSEEDHGRSHELSWHLEWQSRLEKSCLGFPLLYVHDHFPWRGGSGFPTLIHLPGFTAATVSQLLQTHINRDSKSARNFCSSPPTEHLRSWYYVQQSLGLSPPFYPPSCLVVISLLNKFGFWCQTTLNALTGSRNTFELICFCQRSLGGQSSNLCWLNFIFILLDM